MEGLLTSVSQIDRSIRRRTPTRWTSRTRRTLAVVSVVTLAILAMLAVVMMPVRDVAADEVALPNGNFESGDGGDWCSDPPAGLHKIPTGWSFIGAQTWWWDATHMYPYSRCEYFDATHGMVLYMDTPSISNVVFRSGTVTLPTAGQAGFMSLSVMTFKYANGGPSNWIEFWVDDVDSPGTTYANGIATHNADGSWSNHQWGVDEAAKGKNVQVRLACWCPMQDTNDAFIYLDDVKFLYAPIIPEFSTILVPMVGFVAVFVVMVTLTKSRRT